jgi:hypothetical protein
MNAPLMRQMSRKRAEMRGRCAPVSAMRPTEARNARRPRIGAETRCELFRGAYLCLLVGSQRQSLCVTIFSSREWVMLYCAKQTSKSRRITIDGCRARNDTWICRDDAQAAVGDATCVVWLVKEEWTLGTCALGRALQDRKLRG